MVVIIQPIRLLISRLINHIFTCLPTYRPRRRSIIFNLSYTLRACVYTHMLWTTSLQTKLSELSDPHTVYPQGEILNYVMTYTCNFIAALTWEVVQSLYRP